jgi:hypothetical protein
MSTGADVTVAVLAGVGVYTGIRAMMPYKFAIGDTVAVIATGETGTVEARSKTPFYDKYLVNGAWYRNSELEWPVGQETQALTYPTAQGYMLGDYEYPEYANSTDNEGGTLYYETGPISRLSQPWPRRGSYRRGEERREENISQRYGIPRTDVERAMNHYNITEVEYLAHPERYPLPPRGTKEK